MFAGRQLQDQASLVSEGVSDESTVYILMRLLGGAKKRKKKTYTKPKKQKHKHKKIKLAVLKFYKVCYRQTVAASWLFVSAAFDVLLVDDSFRVKMLHMLTLYCPAHHVQQPQVYAVFHNGV